MAWGSMSWAGCGYHRLAAVLEDLTIWRNWSLGKGGSSSRATLSMQRTLGRNHSCTRYAYIHPLKHFRRKIRTFCLSTKVLEKMRCPGRGPK
ncbi:hypothetical protein TNIN_305151 [Trichonephila inaurata madagascariensis]|uniref:Uncharacterized protein n=1 Tax=Trichonephila inaurata madagascariensis TaxID=2747483 RepID=A0A8X6Y868_9ARAC|nr:hypothetical protein TNIN_305151 [Trichonephila inaurata madagascariensis]